MAAQFAPLLLLAEDDDDLRELFTAALERIGFHVVSVDDGFGLLDYFADSLPTPMLIVSDVRMPGRSGLEVAERLDRLGVHVPLILVTAFPDDTLRARALRLGASVVGKPVDPDALAAQLSAYL